ncbi:MAG: cytochrome O ubiquinol oxidase, partial [Acholeplasmataceae bacterium]|nr:cytochrome O ubiquinol oxidase [Acholeplasmataceae bacterium]
GAIAWVTLFIGTGYFFGNMSFVKNNFSHVTLGIIIFSILPIIIEVIRARKENK